MSNQQYTYDGKNNPHTMTDRTKQNEHTEYVLERSADSRSDEIRIITKKTQQVNSHALIATAIDLHAGGQGFDAERCKLALDEVSKCFNLHLHIGGDSVDNGNNDINCKTNSFGNRVRPSEAPLVVYDLLKSKEIKSKIIGILAGNHDGEYGNRNRLSDSSLSHRIADGLGVDYIPYAMIYELPILTPDKLTVKPQYYLFIHDGGKIDSALRLANVVYEETGILVDGMFMEHLHNAQQGIYTIQVPVYSKNGKRFGDMNHDVFIGMGYSFQNAHTIYGAQKMFSNQTNMCLYDISWQLNPYYTRDNALFEPKYKAFVNPFLALDINKNEPSLALKLYQKKWSLNSFNQFKKMQEKKSLTGVAQTLEDSFNTYNEVITHFINKKENNKEKTSNNENVEVLEQIKEA